MELRNDMVKETDGEAFSWTYQTFSIGGAADKYRLTVGEEEGEGFDAMSYHNGQQFTVIMMHNNNCAYVHGGTRTATVLISMAHTHVMHAPHFLE